MNCCTSARCRYGARVSARAAGTRPPSAPAPQQHRASTGKANHAVAHCITRRRAPFDTHIRECARTKVARYARCSVLMSARSTASIRVNIASVRCATAVYVHAWRRPARGRACCAHITRAGPDALRSRPRRDQVDRAAIEMHLQADRAAVRVRNANERHHRKHDCDQRPPATTPGFPNWASARAVQSDRAGAPASTTAPTGSRSFAPPPS